MSTHIFNMFGHTTAEQAALNRLVDQLKKHEGLKLTPYKCTANKLTIGVGRNLEDVGISEEEAEFLLHNDINRAKNQLLKVFPWVSELDSVRFAALINFTFNVGIGTVQKFTKAMDFLKNKQYDKASSEFLNSRWAKQVGKRSLEITEQIRTGEWQ